MIDLNLLSVATKVLTTIIVASCASVLPATAEATSAGHYLKLTSDLDRPGVGYCLDIPGPPKSVWLDRPLVVHSCKPGSVEDGTIELREDGTIWFPALDVCVLSIGDLPGVALMAQACVPPDGNPTLRSFSLFEWRSDQRLRLRDTDLCLSVGTRSGQGRLADHRWRSLFLDVCDSIPLERSQWHLAPADVEFGRNEG